MRVILVCHGETEHPSALTDGHAPLTPLGLKAAEAIARDLREGVPGLPPVEAVYSSPLQPAIQTALLITETLQLPEPALRSSLEHLALESLSEGEELAVAVEVIRRVQKEAWAGIEAFRDSHPDEARVVAVTHRLTIHAVVCQALSIAVEDFRRFRIDTGSMTTLAFRQNRTVLASLNETCHLNGL